MLAKIEGEVYAKEQAVEKLEAKLKSDSSAAAEFVTASVANRNDAKENLKKEYEKGEQELREKSSGNNQNTQEKTEDKAEADRKQAMVQVGLSELQNKQNNEINAAETMVDYGARLLELQKAKAELEKFREGHAKSIKDMIRNHFPHAVEIEDFMVTEDGKKLGGKTNNAESKENNEAAPEGAIPKDMLRRSLEKELTETLIKDLHLSGYEAFVAEMDANAAQHERIHSRLFQKEKNSCNYTARIGLKRREGKGKSLSKTHK